MNSKNARRVQEIIDAVHEEVRRRRESGRYGEGYEESVEEDHNRQLGPLPVEEASRVDRLAVLLTELERSIAGMEEIERDPSRFAPLRYIRELAMTRHQLMRLNREVRGIASGIAEVTRTIVEAETVRTHANERAVQDLLDLVYARTLVMERLTGVVIDLDERVADLESRPKT